MRTTIILLAVLAVIPVPAYARTMNSFERDCREQLGIGDTNLQPGPLKGKLRDCVRKLAAEARRPEESTRSQGRQIERRLKAQEKAQERETDVKSSVIDTTDLRLSASTECREQLNIAPNAIVPPGPQLGSLLRCVERKVSAASRESILGRRRSAVQQRMQEITDRLQQQEQNGAARARDRRQSLHRERIRTQRPINTTRFLELRQSSRARTDFSDAYTEGSTAAKKRDASQCRTVEPKEWAACIREALNQ